VNVTQRVEKVTNYHMYTIYRYI